MARIFILILAILLPLTSSANEQEQAEIICLRVMAMVKAEIIKESYKGRNDHSGMCSGITNSRSLAYWECVEGRMKQGEDYNYASSRCDKL